MPSWLLPSALRLTLPPPPPPEHSWAYLGLAFNFALIAYQWYNLWIIFVPVFMFLLVPFRMELTGETKGFLRVRRPGHPPHPCRSASLCARRRRA